MKFIFSIAICFLLLSCTTKENSTQSTKIESTDTVQTTLEKPQKKELIQIDTLQPIEGTFIVDDYPITNQMLEENRKKMLKEMIKNGWGSEFEFIISNDKTELLVFNLYTDYHRLLTCHFKVDEIDNILDKIERDILNGEQKHLQKFISKLKPANFKKFISNKGIKIGLEKEEVIEIYGTPHKEENNEGIEILTWEFVGDILYDRKTDLNGIPLAKNNYGHQVSIFFKNGKVIGQTLHNDIP
ncbi:hypothetical protein [Bernardetia sp.]|uniref:hypothetical protein n=1 Tax=Bernardetia sp. TaxID=1937974 RepID=UPI0025C35112|nr:hypothetical protein [Bernardetia sp.]